MSLRETQEMIELSIDDQKVQVKKGTTVYQAAKELKIEIPIFCYQDRMPPFGACRVCLVEVEGMAKLQPSCTLQATKDMVVRTRSDKAVQGREGILELLLINHPLDCPICDKGGECPLQDQVYKYGPGESRFFEDKRHFTKALPLGPVLMLDRERCIVCARCTRFGDEVAGDHALEFIERGFRTEVGTPDGAPVRSKFIGNTISICPVGALTSQVYRFRARPWDNTSVSTTCTLCPVGCSMILDSRDDEILRTRACENRDVNDIWLCDKGWFGYQFATHPERLKSPLLKEEGVFKPISWEEAIDFVAHKIDLFRAGGRLAALGGNPLTFEENYLWQKLMCEGAGIHHLDHRVGASVIDDELIPSMENSIGEVENLSYALLCGCDLTEEMAVIWLRLKQAINKGAKVIYIGHYAPEIASHLFDVIIHPPGGELEAIKEQVAFVKSQAQAGKAGAFFVGRQYLANLNRHPILETLIKLREETPSCSLNLLEGNGNSLGACLAGMRPDRAPFGEKLAAKGLNALEIVHHAAKEGWDFLYVAGANPAIKYQKDLWQKARKKLRFLVVQDLFLTETAQEADLVLPTLSYLEKEGHFINIEGRLEKIQRGIPEPSNLYSDGAIFAMIGRKLGLQLSLDHHFMEHLQKKRWQFPPHPKKHAGVFHPLKAEGNKLLASFAPQLFDLGVRMRHNPQLLQLVQAPDLRIHLDDAIKLGVHNGSLVEVKACGAPIEAKIKIDSRVAKGTVVIPLGYPGLASQELEENLLSGVAVEIILKSLKR